MYVSRAVEGLRTDPVPDEPVALALTTTDDADVEAVTRAVEACGGSVDRRLQFDDLAVSVPQARLDEVCAIDGLAAVETTDAIAITTADVDDEDVQFER